MTYPCEGEKDQSWITPRKYLYKEKVKLRVFYYYWDYTFVYYTF